jgi:hypothetical protein
MYQERVNDRDVPEAEMYNLYSQHWHDVVRVQGDLHVCRLLSAVVRGLALLVLFKDVIIAKGRSESSAQ